MPPDSVDSTADAGSEKPELGWFRVRMLYDNDMPADPIVEGSRAGTIQTFFVRDGQVVWAARNMWLRFYDRRTRRRVEVSPDFAPPVEAPATVELSWIRYFEQDASCGAPGSTGGPVPAVGTVSFERIDAEGMAGSFDLTLQGEKNRHFEGTFDLKSGLAMSSHLRATPADGPDWFTMQSLGPSGVEELLAFNSSIAIYGSEFVGGKRQYGLSMLTLHVRNETRRRWITLRMRAPELVKVPSRVEPEVQYLEVADGTCEGGGPCSDDCRDCELGGYVDLKSISATSIAGEYGVDVSRGDGDVLAMRGQFEVAPREAAGDWREQGQSSRDGDWFTLEYTRGSTAARFVEAQSFVGTTVLPACFRGSELSEGMPLGIELSAFDATTDAEVRISMDLSGAAWGTKFPLGAVYVEDGAGFNCRGSSCAASGFVKLDSCTADCRSYSGEFDVTARNEEALQTSFHGRFNSMAVPRWNSLIR